MKKTSLRGTNFTKSDPIIHGLDEAYVGKVRDTYRVKMPLGNHQLAMIVTDRISAFDVVLPVTIPHKGEVLAGMTKYFLEATKDICPNWLTSMPHPRVMIGEKCVPFAIEVIVRGNITGSAWSKYEKGERTKCGVELPEGLRKNDYFPAPIITPTTKSATGHDEDITREEIISRGLATEAEYALMEQYALALFERGCEMAKERGLILVDTKYEFGKLGDTIYLIDEVHTPDSSRYLIAEGFDERQEKGETQPELSKQFMRDWLIEHSFEGKEGQIMPSISEDVVAEVSEKYINLYEQMTGQIFDRSNEYDTEEQILESIQSTLQDVLDEYYHPDNMNPCAIISVLRKDGIAAFSQGLHEHKVNIIASGGTAKTIAAANVPVVDVAAITGMGAMLNHKVVTLCPQIHAGLLTDTEDQKEMQEMRELRWPIIDMVCVNLYDLAAAVANPERTFDSIMQNTDMGGVALIRSAMKGNRLVIIDPNDYDKVIEWMRNGRPDEEAFKLKMRAKASTHIAEYTRLSAEYDQQELEALTTVSN